jgi:hypothetical protein
MKDKPPPTKPDDRAPFDRFREMTQRLLQVDKKALPKVKHKRRRKGK